MDLLRQILPCEQDLLRGHYRQHLDHGIRINCGRISCILQVCLGDEILRLADSATSNFSYLSKRLPPYIFRHFITPNFLDRTADSRIQEVSFCTLNLSRESFSFVEHWRKFLLLHFLVYVVTARWSPFNFRKQGTDGNRTWEDRGRPARLPVFASSATVSSERRKDDWSPQGRALRQPHDLKSGPTTARFALQEHLGEE